jgi:hypothetical protein
VAHPPDRAVRIAHALQRIFDDRRYSPKEQLQAAECVLRNELAEERHEAWEAACGRPEPEGDD